MLGSLSRGMAAAAAAAALLGAPAAAAAAPADLDPSFGAGGRAYAAMETPHAGAQAVVPRPGGGVLAAGLAGADKFGLAALTEGGGLDGSFAGGGTVHTDMGDDAGAFALANAPGGKYVAAGLSCTGAWPNDNCGFGVVRYDSSGAPDPTFGGGDGKVVENVGSSDAGAYGVTVLPDGGIVAVGWGSFGTSGFAVLKLLPNGNPDTGFSQDGKAVYAIGDRGASALDVVVQSSGRIVAAGHAYDDDLDRSVFGVLALDPQGNVDPSFQDDGRVLTPIQARADAESIALGPNEGIVVAGTGLEPGCGTGECWRFAVARYTRDGAPVESFGDGGGLLRKVGDGGAIGHDVAVQADGRIVVAGTAGHAASSYDGLHAGVVRLNTDGSGDSTFDGDGNRTLNMGTNPSDSTAVAIQPNGRIVIAGSDCNINVPACKDEGRFALARFEGGDGAAPYEPPPGPKRRPLGEPSFDWKIPDGTVANFHPCVRDEPRSDVTNVWDFGDGDTLETPGDDCNVGHRYAREGVYRVTLTRVRGDERSSASQDVNVQNWLIVAIGDSYSSGELPGKQVDKHGGWIDRRCHRSRVAYPKLVADRIEDHDDRTSVTFVFLSCSGAQIVGGGLLDRYEGAEKVKDSKGRVKYLPPQVTQVRQWLADHGRSAADIDALMLSIGGNDIQFSKIAKACVWHRKCWERLCIKPANRTTRPPTQYPDCGKRAERTIDFSALSGRYGMLARCLSGTNCKPDGKPLTPLGIARERVFLTEYPHPGRVARGKLEDKRVCENILHYGAGKRIDRTELKWAEPAVLERLLGVGAESAQRNRWTRVTGFYLDSQTHGGCLDSRWMYDRQDVALASIVQGKVQGLLHPNPAGHVGYANRVTPALEAAFYPGGQARRP